MCAQIFIKDFNNIEPSFQKVFRSRLPIDENGIFKNTITFNQAKKLLKVANSWWTGERMIAMEKN